MNILIATDGALPVQHTVEHVSRLYRAGDHVRVMTAVELPRRMLSQIGAVGASQGSGPGPSIADLVEAAGPGHVGFAGGDRVAAQLATRGSRRDHPIDDLLERYRAEIASSRLQPLVDALAAEGIEAATLVRETENRTAATVMDVCRERKIDVLVIGSTGRGRFEGFVGSTGTKLMRHAPCDVALLRVPTPAPPPAS